MPPVLFEIKDAIAIIALNRPDKLNAFNREMAFLLQEKLDECRSSEIRCVFITGTGKGFSAGQDLAEISAISNRSFDKILIEYYNPIVTRIRKLEKPVMAAINGVAAGAGANIALCCDIVVASQSASFIQSFSKIGLIPDSSGSYVLPRLIGWQKASALMMLADKISSEEALQLGMIYKVFPDEYFAESSKKIAETLAQMPTRGLGFIKQALNSSFTNSLEDQLSAEQKWQQKAGKTYDFNEGVKAFLEKRAPRFRGE